MVAQAADWPWSSYGAMLGREPALAWLETDWILGAVRRRAEACAGALRGFREREHGWAADLGSFASSSAIGWRCPVAHFSHSLLAEKPMPEVPRAQRRAMAPPLEAFERRYAPRNVTMTQSFLDGAYTIQAIAAHVGVHYATLSQAVKAWETQDGPTGPDRRNPRTARA